MKVWKYILLIFFVLLAVFAAGGGMALYHDTFVPLWVPLVAALLPTAVVLPAFLPRWRRLPGCGHAVVAGFLHVAVTGSLCFAIFLGANYAFASEPEPHEAVVVGKFRREHTRYRRVSRRVRVPAGKYHTWHVKLEIDDGHCTDEQVSLEKYNRIRKGARRTIGLSRGLFGFTVIKNIKEQDNK